ncbi:MAG: hypothetical protein H6765_03885 [Candidatus Peribacteria bacterium]|nr:MAG: hypothetical protein H6765_03885 [Candidatus Peribacteria bacterium]
MSTAVQATYQRTDQDARLFVDIRGKIDDIWYNEPRSRITFLIAKLQEGQQKLQDDEQAVYILNYFERYLFAKLEAEELYPDENS